MVHLTLFKNFEGLKKAENISGEPHCTRKIFYSKNNLTQVYLQNYILADQ